jgi:Ca2+-dependent lipid-binding protein
MNFLKQLKNIATDSSSSSGVVQNWYITAERAEGLKDKDFMSKSDPYLKIEFGGKSFRTRTIKNDRSPSWNETFHVKLNSAHAKDIHLSLKDDDIGLDDTIGIATISRAELPTYPGEEKKFKSSSVSKRASKRHCSFACQANGRCSVVTSN